MSALPDVRTGVSLPRQFLRPLLKIALTAGPSYGYELTERLHKLGLQLIDTAAIYRMLRSMEHERLVESRWESSDAGPKRRVYELTGRGEVAARDGATELAAIRDLLDHAVGITMDVSR